MAFTHISVCDEYISQLCLCHVFPVVKNPVAKILFKDRIEQHYQQLSPNGRKIADHLLHNPLDVVSSSVAIIADKTGTSKATVSRFFRQLGYASHQHAKQELNSLRASGYPLYIESSGSDLLAQELQRIHQTWNNIDETALNKLVASICQASRVTIIGFRNSYPVALHLRQQLLQIRSKVRLLPQPGQTLSEELQDISADELVWVIGFRRRPKIFQPLMEQLQKHDVALLADPSGQRYSEQVKHLIICQLGQEQALDSYAAPMSIISVICNRVFATMEQSAQQRISAISALYADLDELEKN
jgi:DNA-binding MurR/RpiR family transcriptional regulator